MGGIYYIVFFIGIIFYLQDKRFYLLFTLAAIASNLFGLVGENSLRIKPSDFIVLITLFISFDQWRRDSNYFCTENDRFAKILLVLLFYITFLLLRTVFLNLDSIVNASKVYRGYLVLLIYFYIRKQTQVDIEKFFKLLFVCTFVQGILFYLQLIGISGILAGRIDEATSSYEVTRYANIPMFAAMCMMYVFFNKRQKNKAKIFFLFFFGGMYVIGQMRGAIISLSIAIAIYMYIYRNTKYLTYSILFVALYSFFIAPMFEYRTSNKQENTFEEIISTIKSPQDVYYNYAPTDGTFKFRIAMLVERIFYMQEHPHHVPFGVGLIHEESNKNTFNFSLGTDNESLVKNRVMLSSADIAWVGILMRMGIIGVLIFSYLLIYWCQRGIMLLKTSSHTLMTISCLSSITVILGSFDCENLGRTSTLFVIMLYLAIMFIYKKRM